MNSYPNGPRTFAYWLGGVTLVGAVALGFILRVPVQDSFLPKYAFNWLLALSTLPGGLMVCAVFLAVAAVVDRQNEAFAVLEKCRKSLNDITNQLKK